MIQRAIFLACLIPAVAFCSAASPTLLILPFDNATGDQRFNALQKGMPELLTAALETVAPEIRVVEREKLDAIMAEQGLKWENVMQEKSGAQLGRLTQARYILKGSVIPDHQGIRIQAHLYDTETTRLLKTWNAAGDPKSLNTMADTLARQMSQKLKAPQERLTTDPDPQTHLFFTQGLAFYQQHQYAKAISEFMKALERQPHHADARYALVQSYLGAGLKDDAILEAKTFVQQFPNDQRAGEMKRLLEDKP